MGVLERRRCSGVGWVGGWVGGGKKVSIRA